MEWIKVTDKKPKGVCLVFLTEEMMGSCVQSAVYNKNINLIGNRFTWDVQGEVTHWMPLPKPPTE